jgi:hypothetical protein
MVRASTISTAVARKTARARTELEVVIDPRIIELG